MTNGRPLPIARKGPAVFCYAQRAPRLVDGFGREGEAGVLGFIGFFAAFAVFAVFAVFGGGSRWGWLGDIRHHIVEFRFLGRRRRLRGIGRYIGRRFVRRLRRGCGDGVRRRRFNSRRLGRGRRGGRNDRRLGCFVDRRGRGWFRRAGRRGGGRDK